jgi:hypothetical protein
MLNPFCVALETDVVYVHGQFFWMYFEGKFMYYICTSSLPQNFDPGLEFLV